MATELKFAFVGDIRHGHGINEYFWGDTLPLLKRANCLIGNLEGVVSKIDTVNTNQIGVEIYSNEAKKVVEWSINHDSIGMVSVTNINISNQISSMTEMINIASKKYDWLVAAIEWQGRIKSTPSKEQVDISHKLIDAGAKIVYGNLPHMCQGVEIYNEGLVLYSTGDFIDDYVKSDIEKNEFSMIFGLEGNKGSISKIYMYPTVISERQAKMARGIERDLIVKRMKELCAELGTKTNWNATRGRLDVMR